MNETNEPISDDFDATAQAASPVTVDADETIHGTMPQPPIQAPAVADDSPTSPPRRRRSPGKVIGAILLALVVVAAATVTMIYLKDRATAQSIVSSIEQRDAKLTERSTNALAI
ncbi:MAG: hypothetical protein ACPL2N_06235, partial [Candidatus Cryosericum sp.]